MIRQIKSALVLLHHFFALCFAFRSHSTSLPLSTDKIREVCSDRYNSATDTYEYFGGLGGGPAVAIVTGYKQDKKLLTIYYTWFTGDPSADAFRYAANNSGELVLQLKENQIKYLSNKVIPVASDEHAINPEEHAAEGDIIEVKICLREAQQRREKLET